MKTKKWDSGVLIPGCLLVGIGLGMLFENVAAGTLIGLGVGFLAMYYFR